MTYCLPPVGDFISPFAVFKELSALKCGLFRGSNMAYAELENKVATCFSEFFSIDSVLWYGSGTSALYAIFKSYREIFIKGELAVSAYTCPQVISAAIRAGLKVHLLDIDPCSLEIRLDNLSEYPDIVLLSNLYGLPDFINESLMQQSLIIDDACQGLLSSRAGGFLGAREGTIGVASFGRGKPLSGLGGGAIIAKTSELENPESKAPILLNSIIEKKLGNNIPQVSNSFSLWIKSFLYYYFSSPWLYKIPSSLPFLGLGKTEVDLDFPMEELAYLQLATVYTQLKAVERYKTIRLKNSSKWEEVFLRYDLTSPVSVRKQKGNLSIVPLRFPIVCKSSKQRDSLYLALLKAGLGASKSYPQVLSKYLEFKIPQVRHEALDGAEKVANCILTLPVHSGVRDVDFERADLIIKQILG